MSEESEPPIINAATDVQFGTRALLIIMSVVAVAATALGAFIRSFPEDVRVSLATYWGFLVVTFFSAIIYHARKRYIAEQQAGRIMFTLRRHSYFFPRKPAMGTLVLGLMLVAYAPAWWVLGSFKIARHGLLSGLELGDIYGPIAAGVGVTVFWWKQLRLAEKGLVVRSKFISWGCTNRWYWDACNKNVAVISGDKIESLAILIPPKDRPAVESLLREKVQRQLASSTKTQT
jgi:hypothetical protein